MLIFLARVRGLANPSILTEGHRFFYRIIPTPHNHKIYFKGGGVIYKRGWGKKTPRGTSPRGLNKKQHELSF
jgi:hypothetical protein